MCMPVLTRKILKEISISFVINFCLLSLLAVMPFVDRFCQGLDFLSVLKLLPWIILSSCQFTIPLTAIICCTSFAARYKADREFLATVTSAISLRAYTRPLLAFFFVITSFYLYLSHYTIPQSWDRMFEEGKRHSIQYFIKTADKGFPMVLDHNSRLFIDSVEYDDKGQSLLKNITYTRFKKGNRLQIISADSARILVNDDGSYLLDCDNPKTIKTDAEGKEWEEINDGNMHVFQLPMQRRERNKKRVYWSKPSDELDATIKEHAFEINRRWLNCLITPILALMGFYLGLALPWAHRATAFVTALLPFGLVYFPSLMFFQGRIFKEDWALTSMWLVLVILCVPALWLRNLSKKTGLL
jgi:lipopolysaccharide export LptBFGC system permease protein LptF